MKKKKVVILVDNPLRDLPACTLLASYLSTEAEVYLTPTAQAPQEIFLINPDLVLLNYLRETNLPLINKLIATGIAYSVLDTEGGIFMNIPGKKQTSFTMTLVKDERSRQNLEHYFCWGEVLSNYLKTEKIYPPEKVFCLGTPRMDFFDPSFKGFFGDLRKLKKNLTGTEKSVVLINTSFPGINPKFSTREAELDMLISKFGYDRDFISGQFNQLEKVLAGYIELTRYLARAFPEAHFVLRPHPFENLDVYESALKDLKNVQVSAEKTVVPWILISEALVHYECSTAIEASFAGIPSLSLEEFKEVRPAAAVRNVTEYFSSHESLAKRVRETLDLKQMISAEKKQSLKVIEKEIFFQVDGQSYKRIGDELRRWLRSSVERKFSGKRIGYFLFYSARTVLKKIVKGTLLPEGKRMPISEVQEICRQLEGITQLSLGASSIPLSTSIQISSRS